MNKLPMNMVMRLIVLLMMQKIGKIGTKEVEVVVPLKQSNFRRTLDIPLINCEVVFFLTWSANCVITSVKKREVAAAQEGNPAIF